MTRVFLITGTSTGFGADYVNHILRQGDYVVATARNPSSLKFEGATDKNLLSTRLDVTDKNSIAEAFEKAREKFGRVDVVVNNAGYGLAGCFEELTEEQMRRQMEVNFFGLVGLLLSGSCFSVLIRSLDGCHSGCAGTDAITVASWWSYSTDHFGWWSTRVSGSSSAKNSSAI